MDHWGGEGQSPLQNRIGRIHAVRELDGVPTGTYDVILDNDQQEFDVPMMLPASSYLHKDGKREFGSSGLVPIANVGDNCIVMYLGTQVGLAQPFIMGFFAPRAYGKGGDFRNPRRVRPGSFVISTPYGNGIILRNGGVVEIEAEPHVKRVMTPASPGATDMTGSAIIDRCRNYRLLTAAGEMRMTEIGGGRTAMQFKISEFSSFAKTKSQRESGGGGAERFVEVVWGSAGTSGDSGTGPRNLARETYSGPDGSVVLTQDGAGGWKVEADAEIDLNVGNAVRITARSTGTLEVTATEERHVVVGVVTYEVGEFSVMAGLIDLRGIVVIGGGGLPSATIGDLVVVGDRIGEVVTGSPKLIH
jgi:hypothetical protein